jgi:uncharacterized protein YhfF
MHPSVLQLWQSYVAAVGGNAPAEPTSVWHFCDNEREADELAELVVRGVKRATSPSLWYFESRGDPLPRPGDIHVVTNWVGEARCIIRTTGVRVVPFDEVSAEHAAAEGEGDGSLEHWRQVHWRYYHRELAGTEYVPSEDMPVVCERFEVVCLFPAAVSPDGDNEPAL